MLQGLKKFGLLLAGAMIYLWRVSFRHRVFTIIAKDRSLDEAFKAAKLNGGYHSPLWQALCTPRNGRCRRVVLMPAPATDSNFKLKDIWREAQMRGWQKPTPADMADFAEQYPFEQCRGDIVWFFDCESAGVLCGKRAYRTVYSRAAYRFHPETARAAFILPN